MMGVNSSHPYAGNPRQFVAVAMPNGDAQFGVDGQLVFLCEQRGGCQDRPKFLTVAEAEQLRAALDDALRTFPMAKTMASPDFPRAYRAPTRSAARRSPRLMRPKGALPNGF